MTKELKKQESNLAVKEATLDFNTIMADSGAGSENVTADDTKTPFIRIIQALSPQHQKSEPGYIEGAEQGMLFNTITNETYEELKMLPVHFETRYIEKKRKSPERQTEEFVADHGANKASVDGLKKEGFAYVTAEDNLIYPTATEYVLVLDENNIGKPAVLSFPSTNADQSRRLNTIIAESMYPPVDGKIISSKPPRWYKTFNLGTQVKSKGNNKWHVFSFAEADPIVKITDEGNVVANILNGIDLYKSAKSFKDLISSGEVETQPMEDDAPAANAGKGF